MECRAEGSDLEGRRKLLLKFSNHDECFYGKVWRKQKDIYIQRNEAGTYAGRSAEILSTKNYGKDTDAYAAYSVGRFPPAHIHAMARRYATKLSRASTPCHARADSQEGAGAALPDRHSRARALHSAARARFEPLARRAPDVMSKS